jgi:hypothetical protein
MREMRDPSCDNDSVSPTPAQHARAAEIAAEITARLADVNFALPGTLADRMTRCGHPGCRCRADPPVERRSGFPWREAVAAPGMPMVTPGQVGSLAAAPCR